MIISHFFPTMLFIKELDFFRLLGKSEWKNNMLLFVKSRLDFKELVPQKKIRFLQCTVSQHWQFPYVWTSNPRNPQPIGSLIRIMGAEVHNPGKLSRLGNTNLMNKREGCLCNIQILNMFQSIHILNRMEKVLPFWIGLGRLWGKRVTFLFWIGSIQPQATIQCLWENLKKKYFRSKAIGKQTYLM